MRISTLIAFIKQTFSRLKIFSITKKITAILITAIILISMIIIAFFIYRVEPIIEREQVLKVEMLQEQYEPLIKNIINTHKQSEILTMYSSIMSNRHIKSLYIQTKQYKIGTLKSFNKNSITLFEENNDYYFSTYKLLNNGYYILAIDANSYISTRNNYIKFGLYLALFMLIVTFFIAVILKFLLLPFTTLSILLKGKNLPSQHLIPTINSNDERGDILNAFKKFSRSHRAYTMQLNALNHRLEKSIKEKNHEIRLLREDMHSQVGAEVEKNRNKEKILHEQSRFAAMGEMLGNIAHQWRQPLSAINTAIGNAKIENMLGVTSKESLNETFESIEEYTEYLSNTIEDFRSYFKMDKQRKVYYLSEVINTVLSLTKGNLQDITIIQEYNDGNMKLLGYPNEMMQVIINIINNAKDVFEEKHIARQYIKITIDKSPSHLILKFYDNAGGIDKNIISNIFDPYFTTKHKAQGTGIGLYMSKEIIQKHMKGSLSVSNKGFYINTEEQFGACFSISLPLN